MSLKLNIDSPTIPRVLILPDGTIAIGDVEEIGPYDFCEMVKYVMTNTDLRPDDPRYRLIEFMGKLKTVEGYNPGGRRFEAGA